MLTVAQDGSGDFTNIQECINIIPENNIENIVICKESR